MTSNPHNENLTAELPPSSALPVPVVESSQFLPALTLAEAKSRYDQMVKFTQSVMVEGKDYGAHGGSKPTLLKPGAEKLTSWFGLRVTFSDDKVIERWEPDDPLFYYRRSAHLWRGDVLICSASGSANSWEEKYRWRWVTEDRLPRNIDPSTLEYRGGEIVEFGFAIKKAETTGKFGKPASYWKRWEKAINSGDAYEVQKKTRDGKYLEAWQMEVNEFRIPNPEIFSLVNTLLKMADKRAFIAATLIGCNASEFYTQDLDDLGAYIEDAEVIDVQVNETTSPPKKTQPKKTKRPSSSDQYTEAGKKEIKNGEALRAKVEKSTMLITREEYYNYVYGVLKFKDTATAQQIAEQYDPAEDYRPAIESVKKHMPPEEEGSTHE